jgi:ribose transport system ATP-binding protein
LNKVDFSARQGEIHSLIGQNGAGKSTLMKILGGAYPADVGELIIDEEVVQLRSIADAKRRGIAQIHQELMLASNLDIASNIFLGSEPRGAVGRLNRTEILRRSRELLDRVGLAIDPATPVSSLTAGQMQMVEIARALALNARLVIMDEPTSSLTAGESEHLFKIIRQLRGQGIAIIYISHRMEEVLKLADRITVLRDGKNVGELSAADATHDNLVSMMVGRALTHRFPDRPAARIDAQEMLVVDQLLVPGAPSGISFNARRGEIVGFAGLVGAGRTELMQVIFGVDRPLAGRMLLDAKPYAPRSPRHAIAAGVYLAPEDRKRHGLVLPMTIAQNTSLPSIGSYRPRGFLHRRREIRIAQAERDRLAIKAPSINTKTVNLSGGNQQKVVLGKWLAMTPKVLILDEPTRGIDVGAKAEIYRHMADLAARGITILMVSSEMEEVIGMSDRVVVMHERRIIDILHRDQLTQERIGALMTGKVEIIANAATGAAA